MGERTVIFITILLGALGWLFTHVVERVTDSPTIEYKVNEEDRDGIRILRLRLVNVTRSTSFDSVHVLAIAPENGEVSDVRIVPEEPSYEGDIEPQHFGRSGAVTIEHFMPGARFYVEITYSGAGRPRLRMSGEDEAIRFQRRNLETIFARYEVLIVTALAALWLFLTGTIFLRWWISSRRKTEVAPAPAESR